MGAPRKLRVTRDRYCEELAYGDLARGVTLTDELRNSAIASARELGCTWLELFDARGARLERAIRLEVG